MSWVVDQRCRGRHFPVPCSKSSFLVDVVENRGMDKSWLFISAKGETSGNMSNLSGDSSIACASNMLTGGSDGDVGGEPKESHISPPLFACSDNWPRSHLSLWMRGILWSRGKSRSSIGMATSIAAKRHSSHLTNVCSSTQEMRNWSVSALMRIT